MTRRLIRCSTCHNRTVHDADAEAPARPWFRRGTPPPKPLVIIAIAVSVISLVSGWIGDAFLAGLVDRHPVWLMVLNPRNRNLILVTNEVDAVTYYVVGFLRLVLSDPVNYLLGFWFGERMLGWVERRSRTYGPLVRDGESMFRKFAAPLVFLAPNNIICILAGATGMRVPVFAALNVSGTIVRLIAVRQLGDTLESPISRVVDFIGEYRIPILIVSILAVAWTVFGEFRGDNSELMALRDLADDELHDNGEGDGDEPPSPSDPTDAR